jgi:HSP20 family protein
MMSLRDAMDRLIAESFVPMRGEKSMAAAPLSVDVREQGDNFIVTAPVPGVPPDDVEITILGDTLRIRGERRESKEQSDEQNRWIIREQQYGMFDRTVALPTAVKADFAKAEFKGGVLTITLPKSEEAKERRIPVSAGASGSSQQAEEIPVETGGTQGSSTSGQQPNKESDQTIR